MKTESRDSGRRSSRTSSRAPHGSLLRQLRGRSKRRDHGTSSRVKDKRSRACSQPGEVPFVRCPTSHSGDTTMATMRSVCFFLALLLPWCVQSQRYSPTLARLDEDTRRNVMAIGMPDRAGVLNSLLQSERHTVLRRAQAPRFASQVPKRGQQGSRFALSLDVPTSILSVLIDLAKNQDMRTKAAANAELMARIGKRK